MNKESLISRTKAGEPLEAIIEDAAVIASFPRAKIVDGCLVIDESIIYADDGNAEVSYRGCTADDAAQSYVDNGDWGEITKTTWISVSTFHHGICPDGEVIRCDVDYHNIEINPDEPECVRGNNHDWQSPYELLGGLKENPGVQGHGGGVVCTSVCVHCGKYRVTDSWAQDPVTGKQGLDSIEYRDADDDSREWVEKHLLSDVVEPALDNCDAVVEYRNKGTEIIAIFSVDTNFDNAVEAIRSAINNERIDASWRTSNEEDRTMSITVDSW